MFDAQDIENKCEGQYTTLPDVPGYKLYNIKAVVIATLFGTPLAGGYLMARNYIHLGNKKNAKRTLLCTLLVVTITYVFGNLFPNIHPFVVTMPELLAMMHGMKMLQGDALKIHQGNNGKFESCWRAFGISLVIMIVIIFVFYFISNIIITY